MLSRSRSCSWTFLVNWALFNARPHRSRCPDGHCNTTTLKLQVLWASMCLALDHLSGPTLIYIGPLWGKRSSRVGWALALHTEGLGSLPGTPFVSPSPPRAILECSDMNNPWELLDVTPKQNKKEMIRFLTLWLILLPYISRSTKYHQFCMLKVCKNLVNIFPHHKNTGLLKIVFY